MRWITLATGLMLVAALAACSRFSPTPTPNTAATAPTSTAAPSVTIPPPTTTRAAPTATSASTATPTPASQATPRVEVVATNLQVPWALVFAPDGRLFFTERPGRIRVIQDGKLVPEPVATLNVAAVGEGGLLGLALDPDFATNHFLYVYYTYDAGGGKLQNKVVRLVERDGKASGEKVLLDGIAGASIHDGGRIKFGPDGLLYITTGDATVTSRAQDLASLNGKVLRIRSDGSIPDDNPFPGSPVYTYGHRNPQGLVWQPGTGVLFSTEHGPTGDDEVNIIRKGGNYGWPVAQGIARKAGFIDPIQAYSPSIAPAGVAFYTGNDFPDWKGGLFFGTLVGSHLHRLILAPSGDTAKGDERLFAGQYGRIRDVVMGPDGYLYFTTSNRDGRGSPARDDDRILRIMPGG